MVRNLTDFVNSALNKCTLSFMDEMRICKNTLTKLKEVQDLLKMDNNLFKCVNYKLTEAVKSSDTSSWRR